MMSGVSQFQRIAGSPFAGCGWIDTRSPVRLSKRTMPPFCVLA